MSRKKSLIIASALLLVSVIIAGAIFAWVVQYRRSIMVVSGDAKISVEGWYDLVSDVNQREFTDDKKLSAYSPNLFQDLPMNQFIAYKFQVTNLDKRNATLSMRLSNMFDYIFSSLKAYVDKGGNMTQVEENDFYALAEKNNGRLSFIMDDLYYEYEYVQDGQTIVSAPNHLYDQNDPDDNSLYLWKLSRGEKFIGTDGNSMLPSVPSILLPGVAKAGETEIKTKVNIYMILTSKLSTAAIESYRKWLLGDSITTGAGQEYSANLLKNENGNGFTWAKLTDGSLSAPYSNYADYINSYLEKFVANEVQSIMPQHTDEATQFNLNLDYFEFIGENIPEHAS